MPELQTVHVSSADLDGEADLDGWVVVVAGEDAALVNAARMSLGAGAAVGVVSRSLDDETPCSVRFRADPGDPDAWERIAMHIEQHLGPVDGVVTDASSYPVVDDVFGGDLARRARQPVVVVGPGESPTAVLTALFGTLPAEPSRPAPEAPNP